MRFRFLSFDSCFHRCAFSVLSHYCPSDYGIMTHRLPLRCRVHDSQITPQIMRLCPTDCPSDYEFMTHRLPLGFMRLCPTDCLSDCEIMSLGWSLDYEMHRIFR